jgi:hypothetical protein
MSKKWHGKREVRLKKSGADGIIYTYIPVLSTQNYILRAKKYLIGAGLSSFDS